mmetsp:Transcript_14973/g.28490  ORF Transcript_14973/g.28490 Transcript_14973/m.28490 type:complete len:199 (-) Transcript_14973:557-1153(-)
MSFPRIISVDPIRPTLLTSYPIKELKMLRSRKPVVEMGRQTMTSEKNTTIHGVGAQLDIEIMLEFPLLKSKDGVRNHSEMTTFGIEVLCSPDNDADCLRINVATDGERVFVMHDVGPENYYTQAKGCETNNMEMYIDPADNGVIMLRILVDRSVTETFVQGGRMAKTVAYCPRHEDLESSSLNVSLCVQDCTCAPQRC